MQIHELPSIHSGPEVSSDARELRDNAPDLFVSLLQEGVLENITSLDDLPPASVTAPEGGRSSACYLVQDGKEWKVVKFRRRGTTSETEALDLWRKNGANVPRIYASGTLPTTSPDAKPIQYQVAQTIMVDGEEGRPAPSGREVAVDNPKLLSEMGKLMGAELAKIHAIPTELPFGKYHDSSLQDNYPSLRELFQEKLLKGEKCLRGAGITEEQIMTIRQSINETGFPIQGVVIHGDFALGNTLIKAKDPLKLVVFDPMPVVQNGAWDVANVINRQALSDVYGRHHPEDDEFQEWLELEREFTGNLLDTYCNATNKDLEERELALSTIFRGVHELEKRIRRGVTSDKISFLKREVKGAEDREMRQQIIREQVQKLIQL